MMLLGDFTHEHNINILNYANMFKIKNYSDIMITYSRVITYGLISGILIFIIFALPVSIIYGSLFITEKPGTNQANNPGAPVPTKDNAIEFTLHALNLYVIGYKLLLIVLILPAISIFTVNKLLRDNKNPVKTLVISAVPGAISYLTFSTLYLLFQYISVYIWHTKNYLSGNSSNSYVRDLVSNYIGDLTLLIVAGILISLIGEACYYLYLKKFTVKESV